MTSMRIGRNLLLLALAGLALAIPASAPAAVLTDEEGNPLGKGSTVTLLSSNTFVTTGSGSKISCDVFHMTGEITEAPEIFIDFTEGTAESEGTSICPFEPGFFVELMDITMFMSLKLKRATATFKYDIQFTGLECHLESTGTFLEIGYAKESSEMTIGGEMVRGAGFSTFCPPQAVFHGTFKLADGEGGVVTID